MALRDSGTFMWQHDWNEQGGACLSGTEEHIVFGDRDMTTLVEYNLNHMTQLKRWNVFA